MKLFQFWAGGVLLQGTLCLILALVVAGCAHGSLPPALNDQPLEVPRGAGTLSEQELIVDGIARSFELYVPAGSPSPGPVLFVFHGSGGSAETSRYYGLEPVADREGFSIVYMNGWQGVWNSEFDVPNTEHGDQPIDDLAFFDAARTFIVEQDFALVDSIYVAGVSNGGLMAITLACKRAQNITGAITVSALASRGQVEGCRPEHEVSFLLMLGSQDPLVPSMGSSIDREFRVASFDETLGLFAQTNKCLRSPEEASADLESGTREVDFGLCGKAAFVKGLLINELGHRWPGTDFQEALAEKLNIELPGPISNLIGPSSDEVAGSEVVARFIRETAERQQQTYRPDEAKEAAQ